jgi:glycosyltransferase involved in cell wall biosynthesis
MQILDKLGSLNVSIPSERIAVPYGLSQADGEHPFKWEPDMLSRRKANPSVSCLMVTTGDRWALKYSLDCYMNQNYENRELVIITYEPNLDAVTNLVRTKNIQNAHVFAMGGDLSLGDLRNMSIARARGDILVQWDDDDLFDPLRIKTMVAVLVQSSAAAAFLSRWLIWWPGRRLAAISQRRWWEGSIAMWREYAPVHPATTRGEDSSAVTLLANTQAVVICDATLLYIYAVTGSNTWPKAHFEKMIAASECIFAGEEYVELTKILSARIPILEYERELRSVSVRSPGAA